MMGRPKFSRNETFYKCWRCGKVFQQTAASIHVRRHEKSCIAKMASNSNKKATKAEIIK